MKITAAKSTYTFSLKGVGKDFTVDIRYSPIKVLGSGAYGVVVGAYDQVEQRKVAIKQVSNVFNDEIDALRVLREVKLLRHLNHPNVVGLYDMEQPKSLDEFHDLYLVMEYMDADLHKIIHSRPRQLTEDHIRYILVQLLSGIKHLHSAQVIHRDLKPSNILLNAACDLRICDMGLARGIKKKSNNEKIAMTEYVVTRWYRAPEVLCSSAYSYPVDMWSIGCIFAEMLRAEPLFPGQNSADMLKRIQKVLGTEAMLQLRMRAVHHRALQFLADMRSSPAIPFSKLCAGASASALDLLQSMLRILPEERVSIDNALAHPFLAKFASAHVVADVGAFDFDFEREGRHRGTIRKLMFAEACDMHWPMTAGADDGCAGDMTTMTAGFDASVRLGIRRYRTC